jgi:hypothetical protein
LVYTIIIDHLARPKVIQEKAMQSALAKAKQQANQTLQKSHC